ncbi:hypothetical protein EYC84_007529 [Monilinia fructicola]|uniref:Uncharacterized protein n=1 Tax=Monilinia fructicola TaxID=38448 RepID=A0A5M9JIM7_MONFR|nr:hypothetical protein EYC84_007529 [Monilinia fructicola]
MYTISRASQQKTAVDINLRFVHHMYVSQHSTKSTSRVHNQTGTNMMQISSMITFTDPTHACFPQPLE